MTFVRIFAKIFFQLNQAPIFPCQVSCVMHASVTRVEGVLKNKIDLIRC